jgi:hypothetical protein
MNRQIALLLISIIPLNVSAKNPLEDAPNANYIELQDMSSNVPTHAPLAGDQYSSAAYHPLASNYDQHPDNDLRSTKPSSSTIQRRIFNHTLPEQGLLLILKACFACCFAPEPIQPSNPSDSL